MLQYLNFNLNFPVMGCFHQPFPGLCQSPESDAQDNAGRRDRSTRGLDGFTASLQNTKMTESYRFMQDYNTFFNNYLQFEQWELCI